MTALRVKLDIDTTRDKLAALGCGYAAEAMEPLLAEAVRAELAAHLFLERLFDAVSVPSVISPKVPFEKSPV